MIAGRKPEYMTITESKIAPIVVKGAVVEILDAVVFDFWTGKFPAAQEMGIILERVRASLERVRIGATRLVGVVRHKHPRFALEIHNRGGLLVRRTYDLPVLTLRQVDELDDDDHTVIDTYSNLLLPEGADEFDE